MTAKVLYCLQYFGCQKQFYKHSLDGQGWRVGCRWSIHVCQIDQTILAYHSGHSIQMANSFYALILTQTVVKLEACPDKTGIFSKIIHFFQNNTRNNYDGRNSVAWNYVHEIMSYGTMSHGTVSQKCHTKMSHKTDVWKCRTELSHKTVALTHDENYLYSISDNLTELWNSRTSYDNWPTGL